MKVRRSKIRECENLQQLLFQTDLQKEKTDFEYEEANVNRKVVRSTGLDHWAERCIVESDEWHTHFSHFLTGQEIGSSDLQWNYLQLYKLSI